MVARTLFVLAILALGARVGAQPLAPQDAPNPSAPVQALIQQANRAFRFSREAEAKRLLNQALETARAARDRPGEAAALLVIGDNGRGQDALDAFSKALAIWRELGDRRQQADTWRRMASAYAAAGQAQKSLEAFNEVLSIWRELGDKPKQVIALNEIGRALRSRGDSKQAMESYSQALDVARSGGDKHGEAISLYGVGNLLGAQGEYHRPLDLYNQSAGIFAQLKEKVNQAIVLREMAVVHARFHNDPAALELAEQALSLLHDESSEEESVTQEFMGSIYERMGDWNEALDSYTAAQSAMNKGDDRREARLLTRIALLEARRNVTDPDWDENEPVSSRVKDALAVYRRLARRSDEAASLCRLGWAAQELEGNNKKAVVLYSRALPIARESGDRAVEATILLNLGDAYLGLGQSQNAATQLEQALALQRSMADTRREASTLALLALAETQLAHKPEAVQRLAEAVALREEERAIYGGKAETEFVPDSQGTLPYLLYLDALARLNRPAAAFDVAEQLRAWTLPNRVQIDRVDMLGALSNGEREDLRRAEAAAETARLARKREAEKKDPDSATVAALTGRLRQAEAALRAQLDLALAARPDLPYLLGRRAAACGEAAALLTPNTALLEYVPVKVDKLDETILLCLTLESGQLRTRVHVIARKSDEIEAMVDHFESLLLDDAPCREQGRELYRLLIAPALGQLAGKKRLLICADGPIGRVAFEALIAPGGQAQERYLIEDFEFSFGDSATAILAAGDVSRRKPASSGNLTLLVLTGADRQEATQAERLKSFIPKATIIAGTDAGASGLLTAGPCDYVHIAAPMALNEAAPLLSAIEFTQENKAKPKGGPADITLQSLYKLRLPARVAAFPECDAPGSEVSAALAWALLGAQVPTVVMARMWIDDAATAAIMGRFYGHLNDGEAPSTAMRSAGLDLMKMPAYRRPRYWCSATVFDDPGAADTRTAHANEKAADFRGVGFAGAAH